jgi:hypothetical protein
VTVGNVRVYLVGYILYIIDCHIYQNIFSKIDIIYCKVSYIFKGVLPLETLILYIYRSRGTMQYNQQLYVIYSSNMIIRAQIFSILEVFRCLRPRRPRGDRSRLHRGPRPYFAVDPIDPAAFVALTSSCSSRLEVSACRR